MTPLSERELDKAVADGVISDDQRRRLMEVAAQSASRSAPLDDEPFEIFQGFAEIFIALGIVILLVGVGGLMETIVARGLSPFVLLTMSCGLGHYYARHRRMTLPSIVSLLGVTTSFVWLFAAFISGLDPLSGSLADNSTPAETLIVSTVTFGMLLALYRIYRLPFTMFLSGISLLIAILCVAEIVTGGGGKGFLTDEFFDLRENVEAALGVLGFGLTAFVAALYFDLQDPHRTGGASKTAFWLHIMAGPAIVNTVTLTLFNIGGTAGHVLTVTMLVVTAFISLLIDRRSFLTAGLVYIGAVLGYLTDAFGDNALYVNALIIGILVTSLGTWWRGLRRLAMTALPDFPGKASLAPYLPEDAR